MAVPAEARPSAADISSFLLDLHERSNELGYRELQRFALKRLTDILPFDSGLLAIGTIRSGVPHGHDVVLHERTPEFMASWETVKHEDRIAMWAFTHPGETGNFDVEGPIFDGLEAARAHCRHWGLAHVLCTAMISTHAGLYWVLSTYRADRDKPYSENERQAMQLVVPHVFAAARRARLGQLRARTQVSDGHGQAAAIANPEGLVLEAEPGFAELIEHGWGGWKGPTLPPEIAGPDTKRVVRGRVVITSHGADGLVLLQARRAVAADQLTAREREVAEAFSQGETHREIGERFGLAPTVDGTTRGNRTNRSSS